MNFLAWKHKRNSSVPIDIVLALSLLPLRDVNTENQWLIEHTIKKKWNIWGPGLWALSHVSISAVLSTFSSLHLLPSWRELNMTLLKHPIFIRNNVTVARYLRDNNVRSLLWKRFYCRRSSRVHSVCTYIRFIRCVWFYCQHIMAISFFLTWKNILS